MWGQGIAQWMKVVGIFRELRSDLSQSLPSIHEEAGRLDVVAAERIKTHLNIGIGVFDVMEAVRDPFDNARYIPGGSSLISDGEWVWRQDLASFVERYRVGLPNEFVRHVLASGVAPDAALVMAKANEIWLAYGKAERGG